jgi:RNA polymerase sigma factor (sigma-70 family)
MSDIKTRFETEILPHLDAAYSLARWLTRDENAAEDIVQDAYLRAFQYFESYDAKRGDDASRPWLLGIVRNVCYSWFAQNKRSHELMEYAEDAGDIAPTLDHLGAAKTPETILAQALERTMVNAAIANLAIPYREVLILRELEELSYEDIARITQIPMGTVMSRLSRARAQLRQELRHIC